MAIPFLRRGLSIALTAAIAGALSGCDRQPSEPVRVIAIGDSPRLVDPRTGQMDSAGATLAVNAAQGLVRFDANGLIEPGLAETWNVSDDGLSYIFRLANLQWPGGRKVTADQVARFLRRQIDRLSKNPMKDSFGAVDAIVPMTDRVLEIRLRQPRPHLLQLLAQPAMAIVQDGQGTGPFAIDRADAAGSGLRLRREIPIADSAESRVDQVELSGTDAKAAVEAFAAGNADLVLGGTFADLPLAQAAKLPRGALRFDPALGLFGLIPARSDGPLASLEFRQLLSAAIDRDALVAALAVPGLVPRATVLEPRLDYMADPQPPAWASTPIAQRRALLETSAARFSGGGGDRPVIRVALPDGPGSAMLLDRLTEDWGALGFEVARAANGQRADLKLVDQVAPSTSASWYVRRFRCELAVLCDEQLDQILEAARNTPVLAQRSALHAEAARRIDSLHLFIPLTAPIRWSLVAPRVVGFAGNRFAIHTLTGLEEQLKRTGE